MKLTEISALIYSFSVFGGFLAVGLLHGFANALLLVSIVGVVTAIVLAVFTLD